MERNGLLKNSSISTRPSDDYIDLRDILLSYLPDECK
jgi:hypothetical protein